MPPSVSEQTPVEELPRDFGKYRLEKRIAAGGMAEIFLAHRLDEPLKPLVIKRILPHLVKSAEFVQMFLDEARIAAQLDHPNVVGIQDIGQVEQSYFIAMEYVHGEDIRRIYNRAYRLQRSLPLSHSIRVIADAALGLGHAHKLTDLTGRPLSLVHRDVSPQNILVTYEGEAKVVDFGIAKAANKVAQTRAGVLKGKYSYMSPEQAMGDEIDHRTDIFALGIILYETTTGTRLFKRGNELATLQAIIKCEFVPPSEALKNYPPDLERILLKALAKNPDERWNDAEAFSAALYEFLYDSGLYVEREVISGFMAELFEDRLREEQGTGEPALPSEDEVREEIAASATSAQRPRPPTFDTREEGAARVASHAYGFVEQPENEEDPSGPVPEKDAEDIAAALSAYVPEVGTPSSMPATGATKKGSKKAPKTKAQPPETRLDPDQAETVAVESYRPGKAPEVATAAWTPDSLEPEAPSRNIGAIDETDRVRARGAGLAGGNREGPRPALIALVVGLALLVAVLAAVMVAKISKTTQDPQQKNPIAGVAGAEGDMAEAVILVRTEPGSRVFVDGEVLGAAGPDGEAGPYAVLAGEFDLRVVHTAKGFERSRPISLTGGRHYDIEVPARRGGLRIAVAPWAQVSIDGRDRGLTPLPELRLLEGLHEIVLTNPDIRRRYKGVVRITPGETNRLKVNLQDQGERM